MRRVLSRRPDPFSDARNDWGEERKRHHAPLEGSDQRLVGLAEPRLLEEGVAPREARVQLRVQYRSRTTFYPHGLVNHLHNHLSIYDLTQLTRMFEAERAGASQHL